MNVIWNAILDKLWPPNFKCIVCGREIPASDFPICEDCLPRRNDGDICSHCGRHLDNEAQLCQHCIESDSRLEKMRSALLYTGSAVRLVRGLKFGRHRYLADTLDVYMRELAETAREWAVELVVPVPLSRAHLRERGYNQAELLARPVADALGVPLVTDLLYKIKDVRHQAKLTMRERFENIRDSFAAKDDGTWHNKRILLVDDVMTTGATLEECARVLYALRPRGIYALTLASGLQHVVF